MLLFFVFLLKPVAKKKQLVSRPANCFLISIQKFEAKQSGCFEGRSPNVFFLFRMLLFTGLFNFLNFGGKENVVVFFPKPKFFVLIVHSRLVFY